MAPPTERGAFFAFCIAGMRNLSDHIKKLPRTERGSFSVEMAVYSPFVLSSLYEDVSIAVMNIANTSITIQNVMDIDHTSK